MKRMALVITLTLFCLPAWSGTFKEDFSRGDLAGWQFVEGVPEFGFRQGIPDIVAFQVKSGQLVAEMDLDILVKKGKVAPWELIAITPTNSTWLYSSIQLDGNDFSISCRLQFVEMVFEPRIGIALQTDRQKQGEVTTWDTYMIGLRSLFDWVEIEHSHIEIKGPRFPQGLLHLGNSYTGLEHRLFLRPQVWYRLKVEVKPPDKHLKVFVDDVLFEEFVSGMLIPEVIAGKREFLFPPATEGRSLIVGFNLRGTKVKALFDDLVLGSPSISGLPTSIHPKSKLTTTWGKIKTKH